MSNRTVIPLLWKSDVYLTSIYRWIILLSMLCVSLVACAGSEQDIGVPVRPSTTLQPYLMVLAPSGERAYVMYHGKLVQYDLNPLSIISSVDIDVNVPPLDKKHPLSVVSSKRLFVSKDENRMLIYDYNYMKLFDMATNKVIKTIPLNEGCAVLNEDMLVTFEKNSPIVTLWNANDLTQIRQFRSGGVDWKDGNEKMYGATYAHKVGTYIFSRNGPIFRVLDSKTYKEIIAFRLYGPPNVSAWIDYDLKTLWLANASLNASYSGPRGTYEYLKFHFQDKTIEEAREPASYRDAHLENIRLYTSSAVQVSPVNQYSVTEGTLIYRDKHRVKSLYQFPDGEAVLWNIKTKYFQATKDALKHLTMKNANGEVVPMNIATFNKFNRAGISHLEW